MSTRGRTGKYTAAVITAGTKYSAQNKGELFQTDHYLNKGIIKKKQFKAQIQAKNKELDVLKKTKQEKKSKKNLNDQIRCPEYIKCGSEVVKNHVQSYTISRNVPSVTTYSDHLDEHLLDILSKYGKDRIIVGCIAWFSNPLFIDALTKAKCVSFIINDEQDFSKWGFGTVKREKYEQLPGFKVPFSQIWKGKIESPLNTLRNVYEPMRCFGNRSQGGGGVSSILHAKFLVICDDNDIPRWTWNGSMNFTQNAVNNIEVVQFVEDTKTALHLFFKFGQIFIFSKPINFGDK